MSKVWIDVTTTMNWNRPAVGIVRVEQELIKYALENKSNVGFFIYETQCFSEIDRENVIKKVYQEFNQESVIKKAIPEVNKQSTNRTSFFGLSFRRIRNSFFFFFRAIYEFSMSFVNDNFYNRINHLNHIKYQNFKNGVKSRIRRVVHKNPQQQVPFTSNFKPKKPQSINLTNGDTVMSVGLSWDHGSKFRDLYDLKKVIDIKVIAMCYDLIPIKVPNLFISLEHSASFERYYDGMTWAADAVACISKSSQNDYIDWLTEKYMPRPYTKVVTLGSTIVPYDESKLSQTVKDIDQKFILFVSTIERRKNHETIIKAIQYLKDHESENIPLVIFVGMRGWGVGDMLNEYEMSIDLKKYIKILNNLGDNDLSYLYQKCEFFLYPSFYEGWGLPVAEGLTYGKFGICSMSSSIPEVGGDLLEYVYPYDVLGWASKIEQFMRYPEQLRVKEERIKSEFKEYTWNNFGSQMFDIAESIVNVK